MNKQDTARYIQLTEIQPFYYVRFRAQGIHPEHEVYEKMCDWLEAKGYVRDMSQHHIFGFNHPDAGSNKEEYSYELWLQVNPEELGDTTKKIYYYDGGRYAVTTTKLMPINYDNIIHSWPQLVNWAKNHGYKLGSHQWFEKDLTPFAKDEEKYLELYLPIE